MGKAGSSNEKCSGLVLIKNQVVRYGHALSLHTNKVFLFGRRDRQAKGHGLVSSRAIARQSGERQSAFGEVIGQLQRAWGGCNCQFLARKSVR